MRYIEVDLTKGHCASAHYCAPHIHSTIDTWATPIGEGCYRRTNNSKLVFIPETHPCFNINIVIWELDIIEDGDMREDWLQVTKDVFKPLEHFMV